MTILELWNLIVPIRYVYLLNFFGLIITTLGATYLVGISIKTNSEVKRLSSYEDTGIALGVGKQKKENLFLKVSLIMARDSTFTALMMIMVGFTLQLIFQIIELFYLKIIPLGHYIAFVVFIIVADGIIWTKMKKRKKRLEQK